MHPAGVHDTLQHNTCNSELTTLHTTLLHTQSWFRQKERSSTFRRSRCGRARWTCHAMAQASVKKCSRNKREQVHTHMANQEAGRTTTQPKLTRQRKSRQTHKVKNEFACSASFSLADGLADGDAEGPANGNSKKNETTSLRSLSCAQPASCLSLPRIHCKKTVEGA